MIRHAWVRLLIAIVALLVQTSAVAQNTPRQASALRVEGNVENRLTLTVADLRSLPVQQVEDTRQVRVGGVPAADGGATRRYAGVLLRDVLAAARPVEKERHDLRRSIVVATATDGYQAVFSWAELFLSRSVTARWSSSSATALRSPRAKVPSQSCPSRTRSPARAT